MWWRVWVLYPLHSRLVGTFGAVMVLFTLGTSQHTSLDSVSELTCYSGTGVLITHDSCSRDNVPFDIGHAGGFGPLIHSSSSILPRNLWGSIATLLSLVTNVLAETLIIYRTWSVYMLDFLMSELQRLTLMAQGT